MAHIKNEEIYLYTGFTSNGDECYKAFETLKNAGVQFRHLHYSDATQYQTVFDSIYTWFKAEDNIGEIKFPFVTYTKVFEITDPVGRLSNIVIGINNISNTDWKALENFSG